MPEEMGIEDYRPVAFNTADGLNLQGWYIPSENGAAIILGHGQGGNRTMLLNEAKILADQGYGVLLFDWRAHGKSDGNLSTMGANEQYDLIAALDFVSQQPDVNPEKIGALGFSAGAVTVSEVAASDSRLKAVVVEAAYPTLRDVVYHRTQGLKLLGTIAIYWTEFEAGIKVDSVQPVERLCDISPRPILLIYGGQDELVPADSAQRMIDAACEPKELWIIESAGHGNYAQAAGDEYSRRLIAFFDVNLLDR
jgi:dipeptidyl aminopeptidase/acylaminoacyl peptidase